MELKVGSRWRSTTGTTEVVVVRVPRENEILTCGGQEMVDALASPDAGAVSGLTVSDSEDPVLLGKRYVEEGSGIEVLCTKPGAGPLAFGGIVLVPKSAKPLPSSD